MSITTQNNAQRGPDSLAIIGRTLHDLRGIRFGEGEGGNAPAAPVPAAPANPQFTAPPAVPAAPAAPAAEPAPNSVEKVEDLPAWAQKIITDTRKEAADSRGAKNAETERVNAILKAAGIQTDAPDPVAVAKTATEAATAAKRELAVFKSAAASGADPSKLLDRASFLTSIESVDPSDGPAMKAAIEAAVAADATLKTARAAGASAIDGTGGTGEVGQLTEAQVKKMTPEQIVAAEEKGLLRDYLAS